MLRTKTNYLYSLLLVLTISFSSFGQLCGVSVVPPATINGVSVTGGTISGTTTIYAAAFTSCSMYSTPPNSIHLGGSGAFVYGFTFSQPVNDLVIIITATGNTVNEVFDFTTNSTTLPVINDLGSCFTTVTGNSISSGAGSGGSAGGGGGIFEIHSPSGPFTSLQISGLGGAAGSLFALCETSVVPSPPTISSTDPCFGSCNGSAQVDLSGTPPYTYVWDNGDTTAISDSLCPGTYTCIVTDGLGTVDTLSVTLNEGPQITIDTETITDISCNGNSDGSYFLTASGGTGNLSFLLDTIASGSGIFSNLNAGNYPILITDEENCSITDTVSIVEPDPIVLQIVDSLSPTCNSNSDGFIEVLAQGGSGNYSYFLNNISNGNSGLFQNLSSGNYQIHVEDNNGCSDTISLNLTTQFNANFNIQTANETCFNSCNGSISINTPTPQYFTFSIDNCISSSANNVFTDLCPGQYIICVNDTVNCSFVDTVNIDSAPNSQQPDLTNISDLCLNDAPVNIQAVNLGTLSGNAGIVNNTFDPSLAGVGTHQIINTTSPTCNTSDTIYVSVNGLPLVDFIANDSLFCENELLQLTDMSDPAISYFWELGNIANSNLQNPSFNLASSGTYDVSLTVIDANNCSNTLTIPNWITVEEKVEADFQFTVDPVNQEISFLNTSVNAQNYLWQFSNSQNSTVIHPTISYSLLETSMMVHLNADNNICEDSITKYLEIPSPVLIYVPNTFTPNGDESNPAFLPILNGLDDYDYQFTIYNRWGELLFKTSSIHQSWDGSYDGKIVPDGTYVWRIELSKIENADKIVREGYVNVLK